MRALGWTLGVLGLAAAAAILVFAARQAAYEGALARRSPWALDRLAARHEARLSAQRITEARVRVTLAPAEGAFTAGATLSVALREAGARPTFLLHESLRVTETRVNGRVCAFRREGLLLILESDPGPGTHEIRVVYRHDPVPHPRLPGRITAGDVILPALGLWYPVDFQGSHVFHGEARLPAGMDLITTGRILTRRATPTREILTWDETAPVFAAPLVAGLAAREGAPGTVRHFSLGPADLPGAVPRWREDAARIDAWLRRTLGDPGFGPLLIVQTAAVAQPEAVGAGVVLAPGGLDTADHGAFVALARAMARVWWADGVTGRWLAARPEGGRWMTEALPQYYALRALEDLRGEAARLAWVDAQDRPWRPAAPLRDRAMRESLVGGMPDEDFLWHGAQAASLFAALAGPGAFDAAAQRFLAVHRGRPVGVDALFSELSLATGRQFPAAARGWLDTVGVADPALASVVAGRDTVHLRVTANGDLRPLPPVEVALFGAEGVRIHVVDAARASGAITLPAPGPVERVVLDPRFRLPDVDRRNNVWPGPVWPGALAAHPGGAMAIGLRPAANAGEIDAVLLTQTAGGVDQHVPLMQPADAAFAWSPDGGQVAFGGAALQIWSQDGGVRITRGEPAHVLGWAGDTCWAHDPMRNVLVNAATGAALGGIDGGAPRPLTLRAEPASAGFATLLDDGSLATWLPGGGTARRLSPALAGVGDAAWSPVLQAWIAMDRVRGLVAIAQDGHERQLLRLPYPVGEARVAPDAAHAAWIDPARKLRLAAVPQPAAGSTAAISHSDRLSSDPEPGAPSPLQSAVLPDPGDPSAVRTAAVPGEIVAFAWQGGTALAVLAREAPPVLPTPFHGVASLWRVTTDGVAQRLGTLAVGPDGEPYLRRGR